ncbi:ATP-binding protein [Actinomadura latina]|uniref:ATP-binding protein n=1 Tax=Actinomadura latina TaxID=163603 RepID=A0A846Z1Q5_9ACTN|nr:ATP-binding protein [Actinomadura latina]NKZ05847.1 ATP-binding protein [Actinomadura latina]
MIEGTSAGPKALRRSLLATPDAVQQGRLIVESQALQWRVPQSTVDDAALIASELLTNASRATPCQAITLRLALVPAGLRIEVWDGSPEKPQASTPDLTMPTEPLPDDAPDPGGWGLSIIASLAEEHGCRPEHGGKSVWAVLPTTFRRSS